MVHVDDDEFTELLRIYDPTDRSSPSTSQPSPLPSSLPAAVETLCDADSPEPTGMAPIGSARSESDDSAHSGGEGSTESGDDGREGAQLAVCKPCDDDSPEVGATDAALDGTKHATSASATAEQAASQARAHAAQPADAVAARAAWPPCPRAGCGCVSFNGVPGEYCSLTCRGSHTVPGKPCTGARWRKHPWPTEAPPTPPTPKLRPDGTAYPRCVRADCPCTCTYDGEEGEHCCITCLKGQPCAKNVHLEPSRHPRKGARRPASDHDHHATTP